MTTTTIKVTTELRDRLSRLARARRISQGAVLDDLLRRAEEEQFWQRMAQTPAQAYRSAIEADGDELSDDYSREDALIEDGDA